MTENVGTSSNFHVSPTFDADDYQENITQDEPIDPVNIDDRYLPNYGTPSASDSDDLPNAEESGDNVPFEASSNGPNIFGDTHDEYSSQRTWCEPEDFMNGAIYIEKGMLFNSKKRFAREAIKLLHLKIAREYFVIKSTKKSWRLVCRRVEQGCRFRLTSFNDKHTNMWKMIANVLRVDIEKRPRFPIKDCQTAILKAYGISISRRKAYLGRKRAFEKVYGTWEGSFAELPRFMETLKHFNPRTIVEWKTERRVDVIEDCRAASVVGLGPSTINLQSVKLEAMKVKGEKKKVKR
ncbi:hypothetical protein H5410_032576 [Solanum commersonii]|uniref:Transposase MuDR plant domain-containing protein n=1 Tax=Solanum commersonii TaxID=4109 RepID=A0A9J5YQP5_SOLCO|nr:hypothetical protein H5410_032576 [Solanum commersonii]